MRAPARHPRRTDADVSAETFPSLEERDAREGEQPKLGVDAAGRGEAAVAASGCHYPMAGNDQWEAVVAHRLPHSLRRTRRPDPAGELAVGRGDAAGKSARGGVDPLVELRDAVEVELHIGQLDVVTREQPAEPVDRVGDGGGRLVVATDIRRLG